MIIGNAELRPVGEFEVVSGKLQVSDPYYAIRDSHGDNLTLDAIIGTWQAHHAFAPDSDQILGLVAHHCEHPVRPDDRRWSPSDNFMSVDSGLAGVFDLQHFGDDAVAKAKDLDSWFELCGDRSLGTIPFGAFSTTAIGDGAYGFETITDGNEVVAVAIVYVQSGLTPDLHPELEMSDSLSKMMLGSLGRWWRIPTTIRNSMLEALGETVDSNGPLQRSQEGMHIHECYLEMHEIELYKDSHKWWAGLAVDGRYVTAYGRVPGYGRERAPTISKGKDLRGTFDYYLDKKFKKGYRPSQNALEEYTISTEIFTEHLEGRFEDRDRILEEYGMTVDLFLEEIQKLIEIKANYSSPQEIAWYKGENPGFKPLPWADN